MENEKEFLMYLIKKQGERLFDYTDLGYAKAFTNVINKKVSRKDKNENLSNEDGKWLEFYKEETKELSMLIKKLNEIIEKKA